MDYFFVGLGVFVWCSASFLSYAYIQDAPIFKEDYPFIPIILLFGVTLFPISMVTRFIVVHY